MILPALTSRKDIATRRRFLHIGTSGLLGIALPDLLWAEANRPVRRTQARNMIFVWLGGGPSTIDMWDPKPDAPAEIRGEFKAVGTSVPGVALSDQMPRTAEILDRCVLIRSLQHNIPDHLPGAQYVMTGNKPSASLEFPSLGSLAARLLPSTAGMPASFSLGEAGSVGAGFLGPAYAPFRVASTSKESAPSHDLIGTVLPPGMTRSRLEDRRRLRDGFDADFLQRHKSVDVVPTLSKFQQNAYEILASDRIGKAFDLAAEPDAVRNLYGTGSLGSDLLIARRIIEAGARCVVVGTSGWDTHAGNFATLRNLLPPLDQALAGLVVDLQDRDLLQHTLVVCGGEFGRTPKINAAAGRDHWSRTFSFFLSGGGLKAGCIHGATDARGFEPTDRACSPDDLAATLLTLLGFPPHFQVQTTTGRPVELSKYGSPIEEILA